jgi:hypothetical protein
MLPPASASSGAFLASGSRSRQRRRLEPSGVDLDAALRASSGDPNRHADQSALPVSDCAVKPVSALTEPKFSIIRVSFLTTRTRNDRGAGIG